MRLPFAPEAMAELEGAVAWYEDEQGGLGARFAGSVERAVERAAEFPGSGAPVPEISPEHEARHFSVRGFPYLVVTAKVGGVHAVLAVAHTRRRPGYWRERLNSPGR